MRAALQMKAGEPLVIVDDIEIEDPRHDEVKVRVHHCGICHSDMSMMDMGLPGPTILGHEAAGVVEAIGASVTTCAVGDKVLLTPLASCGVCYWCSRQQPTLCKDAQAFSSGLRPDGTSPFSRNGEPVFRGLGVAGFGEYTVVSESSVVRLGADIPLDVACVVGCAVQTGTGAVLNAAEVEAGATVLVTGLGGIGQAVVQGAVLAGAGKIIVSDPVESRREAATGFGADVVVDPASQDVQQVVLDQTDGIGVDYAFEAAGVAALTETCMNASRIGGTTVIVGADATLATVPIMPVLIATHGKTVMGTLLGDCHSHRDVTRFMNLWQNGRLDLDGLITHRFPLAEINDGVANLRAANGIRTTIDLV